jgi:hypothetical protein
MRQTILVCVSCFLLGAVMTMNGPDARAQTQAEVDEATRRAAYAEALKREAEAKKALATAEAEAGNAAESARLALAKAELESEKAKLEYQKALLPTIPDPSRYKVAAPNAPVVAGTATRMAYAEADALAPRIVEEIEKSLPRGNAAIIVPDDPRTRTLIALSRALRESLGQARDRIQHEWKRLDQVMTAAPVPMFVGPALPLVGAIGEMALSYAQILRAQYDFGTSSQTVLAETVLQARVSELLLEHGKAKLVDPDAVVVLMTAESDTSVEMTALREVRKALTALREKFIDAGNLASRKRSEAPRVEDKGNAAARAAAMKTADEIDAAAKSAGAVADEVHKFLAALFVADAQGISPLDAALRGGVLNDLLAKGQPVLLSVKAVSADVDTIASDKLFRGLRVSVSSNTVARWRLVAVNGTVLSTGAVQHNSKPERVEL